MCFIPPVQMANKLSNHIILLLLVLAVLNLKPSNPALLPSSLALLFVLNMILVSIFLFFFFFLLHLQTVNTPNQTVFSVVLLSFSIYLFTFQNDRKIHKNSLISLLVCLKWSSKPLHRQLSHRMATAFEWICLDSCRNTLFYKIHLTHFQALVASFVQL